MFPSFTTSLTKLGSTSYRPIQEFKALIENQTRKKIKVLRSNNGGEYTSKEFEGF
jgi:hypothetical protein